jgi:hypothetical protein
MVLVDLLKGCELALEGTHLAENVFEGRWLLGHGCSLHGTILGPLAACHCQNLNKFLGEIARACCDAKISLGDTLGDQIPQKMFEARGLLFIVTQQTRL